MKEKDAIILEKADEKKEKVKIQSILQHDDVEGIQVQVIPVEQ